MRTLIHISDLHFDRVDADVVEALATTVAAARPDVVAVSGDLTQRALSSEFAQARAFLDRLPQPQIVVPGNHDLPLYNLVERLCRPRRAFRRHISRELRPYHADAELLVLGVDTTHALSMEGTIRSRDIDRITGHVRGAAAGSVKMVVCHHPVDRTVERLARNGVDLFLTGHLHISSTAHTAERFGGSGFSAIVVSGGTATSTRVRGEGNAFNLLRIERDAIVVEHYEWRPALHLFDLLEAQRFGRTAGGWLPA
jgi:3',5'-cyclic AMP phosphodiesterase CpdA